MIKIFHKRLLVFCIALFPVLTAFHPYYVSVTDIKYKDEDRSLQVSCKIFTNDLESTLRKIHKTQIDLLHPKDKAATEKQIAHYINTHLKINVNKKMHELDFIGYEKEEEAVWVYFEIKNVDLPKTVTIENNLLYEYLPAQINMVHLDVKDNKQSSKVSNPEKKMEFSF